ncbi:MAG: NAD kinase [Bacteroidaceae bacterium]|nr:NAD kinase [Bacteroidaceae bacterium]
MEKRNTKYILFGNTYQAEKSKSIGQIINVLQKRQTRIAIEADFYQFIQQTLGLQFQPDEIIHHPEDHFSASFAISMGGDGTFLKTAAFIGNKGIPIIGINTGRLGFLADVLPEDIEHCINALDSGDFLIERRSLLRATDSEGTLQPYPYALNEVAILKHDNSSMISIQTRIDDNLLTTYQADGLIISTPTGSTGYSLSVGGPIISPTSHSIVLTPVAPHSLNIRPIVLNDDITIRLSVKSRNHHFLASIDGRSQSLPDHVEIMIRRAPYYINVVKRQNTHFFQTLRNKLLWGADIRV